MSGSVTGSAAGLGKGLATGYGGYNRKPLAPDRAVALAPLCRRRCRRRRSFGGRDNGGGD